MARADRGDAHAAPVGHGSVEAVARDVSRYHGPMSDGLRLMVFDSTCVHPAARLGLTTTWQVGARLYGALGRIDAWRGVTSWTEALCWLAETHPGQPIAEVQYWGHGHFGSAVTAGGKGPEKVLDARALVPGHVLHDDLLAVRERLSPKGLWWFRTCQTFGTERGHAFAQAFTAFLGRRAAGHTHIIGPWQSGLHSLLPGEAPTWSTAEGTTGELTPRGTPKAKWSTPWAPRTINCLDGAVPAGW
jgi:hypothetical protein